MSIMATTSEMPQEKSLRKSSKKYVHSAISRNWSGGETTASAGSANEGRSDLDFESSKDGRDDPSSDEFPPGLRQSKNLHGSDALASETTAPDRSATLHPSLDRDGPRHTKGSAQHDAGECKPCAFYCFSYSGCHSGDSCNFCHLFHRSKSLIKRDVRASKKPQLNTKQDASESESGTKSSDSCGKNSRKSVDKRTPLLDESVDRRSEATYVGQPAAAFQPISITPPMPKQLLKMQGASSVGDFELPNPLVRISSGGSTSFSYMPRALCVAIGQEVEFLPDLDGSYQPRLFAISPELPQGLTIDRFTGVIYGRPQEVTDKPYFVSACEPMVNFNTVSACVYLTVTGTAASGYQNEEFLLPDLPTWMANVQQNCDQSPGAIETVQQMIEAHLMGTVANLQLDA